MDRTRMNRPLAAVAAALATLAVVGCSDNDLNRTPRTTTQIAIQEIEQNTGEFAVPVEINDLPISDADTSETGRPNPI